MATDTPYIQETNHTTPEVSPYGVELVAVIDPPEGSSLPSPTQITADGILVPEGDGWAVVSPHDETSVRTVRTVGDSVLVLTAAGLEVWTGTALESQPVPEGYVPQSVVDLAGDGWMIAESTTEHEPRAVLRWRSGTGSTDVVLTGPVDALGAHAGQLLVASGTSLSAYAPEGSFDAPSWTVSVDVTPPIAALVGDLGVTVPFEIAIFGASDAVGIAFDDGIPTAVAPPILGAGRVPFTDVSGAVAAPDGGLVAYGPSGAERLVNWGDGLEWRVYPAERWLPSEDVRDVAFGGDDRLADIWFATTFGLATVTSEETTVEAKLAPYIDRILERHSREGAVSDSHLLSRGNIETNVPWDSDNDGGWTAYWLFTECYRWKVTGAPDARENFDEALDAMLRLHDLTGTDYFLARSVIRREGCELDDCDGPDDGEWFLSPDEEFWVKGDTSNDEVIAHAFMMGPAYDLCADDDQRERIERHIGNIVGGIIDNDFMLVDIDGEVTTFGRFDPWYVNEHPGGRLGDGGRLASEMLALLTFATYLTGEPRFEEAKRYLMDEHGYADNAVRSSEYPGARHTGDMDELGAMAWFVLLRYETDPELRARWVDGWSRGYSTMRLQQGAWWDVANAIMGGPDPRMDYALRWLRRAPVDLIRWNIHNSHRQDLVPAPGLYQFLGWARSDGRILPYDERACERWNTNQFRIDGGHGGWTEMDGADITAPYWMARYYGYIAGP